MRSVRLWIFSYSSPTTQQISDSVAVSLPADIVEQILIRVDDVKVLIRFKSVCKSWKSLILSSRFIKAHLNRNIDKFGHKMSGKAILSYPNVHDPYGVDRKYYIMGCSNGLVCIANFAGEVIIANPSTREMKTLPKPFQISNVPSCWGFGYDSSTDDYKVVIGFLIKDEADKSCFQVLSLKSNVWKITGQINYGGDYNSWRAGVLCNGALHWAMMQSKKNVILSFDLSIEDFKEIPEPGDHVNVRHSNIFLGIMENCLCISNYTHHIWIMKKFNVKQSWEIGEYKRKIVLQSLLSPHMSFLENDIPYEFPSRNGVWLFANRKFIDAPIVLQSLLSPHLHTCNDAMNSGKLGS